MGLRIVDKNWFVRLITAHHGSLRALADKMRLESGGPSDVAHLSRLMSGKRAPSMGEILQFAELLDAGVLEVIERFGYDLPRPRKHAPAPKGIRAHGNWSE